MLSVAGERITALMAGGLALVLALGGGCRGYRSCGTSADCETGDVCLPARPGESVQYCGREAAPETSSACNQLELLGQATGGSFYGRQVLLRRVSADEVVLLGTGSLDADARRFKTDKTTSLIYSDAATNAKIFVGDDLFLRISKNAAMATNTDINLYNLSSLPASIDLLSNKTDGGTFSSDAGVALFQDYGIFGDGDNDNQLKYFDKSSVTVQAGCSLASLGGRSLIKSTFAVSDGQLVLGIYGALGTPSGVFTASQIGDLGTACRLKALDQDAQFKNVTAVASFGGGVVAGGLSAGVLAPTVLTWKSGETTPSSLSFCSASVCLGKNSVALALDGSLLAVGISSGDQDTSGAVALFQQRSGTWNRLSLSVDPVAGKEQGFGSAVAIAGEFIAVGAPGSATAYVYRCAP